jgi:hypothetical protein
MYGPLPAALEELEWNLELCLPRRDDECLE